MREFHEDRLSDCRALHMGLNELCLYCPYFFIGLGMILPNATMYNTI